MKLLGGIALLCLSATWIVLWCAQLSEPLLADYQVVFILVASLALIPVLWATSLLDRAQREPVEPAAAPKPPVALPPPKPHIEATTESDDQFGGLTLDERDLAKTVLRGEEKEGSS